MKSAPTAAVPRCWSCAWCRAVCPTEDALDHGPARLGDAVADVPGGALVDRAGAPPTGLGQGIVLGDVRRDVEAAQGETWSRQS